MSRGPLPGCIAASGILYWACAATFGGYWIWSRAAHAGNFEEGLHQLSAGLLLMAVALHCICWEIGTLRWRRSAGHQLAYALPYAMVGGFLVDMGPAPAWFGPAAAWFGPAACGLGMALAVCRAASALAPSCAGARGRRLRQEQTQGAGLPLACDSVGTLPSSTAESFVTDEEP